MMKMSFGKYRGKPVGWVLISDIMYFVWMKRKDMVNKPEYKEFLSLVDILDSKPFLNSCMGICRPRKPASCFSIYTTNPIPYYYCEDCDPYTSGAIRGKLSIGKTIFEAVRISSNPNTTVSSIANAKGCPKRKTESALDKSF